MATEDHDFEEINFSILRVKFPLEQRTGPVGRLSTEGWLHS
jgi:hypothetical protein